MSAPIWPKVSLHESEDTEDHALALLDDFDEFNEALNRQSRFLKLSPSPEELISNGVSEVLAEASSIGYFHGPISERDKQRLRDIVLKKFETQTALWAPDRVPRFVYGRLVDSYRHFLLKLRDLLMSNGLQHSREDNEVAKAQALELVHSDAVQECPNLKTKEARAATLREEKLAPVAKDVDQRDRLNENEARDDEGAKAENAKGAEESKDEESSKADRKEGGFNNDLVESDKEPKLPEPVANNDLGISDKELHKPLAHRSPVVFNITSQAVVNVLYDMDSKKLLQALSMAIKKKKQKFSGFSFLSDVGLSDNGDVTAVTHNNIAEDISLLEKMSSWDSGIIDNDLGMNFGSRWCYRVHMTGFEKVKSLGVDLASRKQKAMLVSELVRVNITTLTSLRIHHIKDIEYIEDLKGGSTSLAVDFHDIEQANVALSRGLNYNGTHYDCETPQKERFLARCGNCQAYGHQYAACSNAPRCGKCAQQHQLKECKSPHEKCALCNARGHGSSSSNCPIKRAKRNSVRLTTVAARRSQAAGQAEEVPPPARSQEINDAANHAVESGHGIDLDTPHLWTAADIEELDPHVQRVIQRRKQEIQELEDIWKSRLKSRQTNGGLSRKRRALEPLVNGASDDSRSAKRIKPEDHHAAETREF